MNHSRLAYTAITLLFLIACQTTPTSPNPKPNPTEPTKPKPGELGVTLSPSTPVYTNGTITLQVNVVGGTPDSVQLLKNDMPFAPLSTSLKYEWNTKSEPEGSYTLKARAIKGDKTFDSNASTVVIDRTKPTVIIGSRQPVPGATNISVRAPISVSFSESLNASSLSDGAVTLLNAAQRVSKSLARSSDGLTLTIIPTSQLITPGTLEVTFSSALTDLAGNSLAPVSSSWKWELPKYFEYGTPLLDTGVSGFKIDSQGNPVVITHTYEGDNSKTLVKRWTPNGWEGLGTEIMTGRTIYLTSLVLDASDTPHLLWLEDGKVYVKRWNGSSWETLGDALNISQANTVDTATLELKNQKLYVAWREASSIYVRQWTGSAWVQVADALSLGDVDSYITPQLALTSDGRPIYGWCGQLLGKMD
jgi:hypothetical protein